ncbi:MAG TPA: zf-TFIIB domain-containing protein [Streptosporangiaceae bacterium]|nr:zf-TFIIB domain-containing protein [Streptosporangiaceae bacterium]
MVDAILRCPKCHAGMMSARRDGVLLDQCGACRGVFLAEGDLTRLIESAGAVPAVVAPMNGYPKQVYEGRHRRD